MKGLDASGGKPGDREVYALVRIGCEGPALEPREILGELQELEPGLTVGSLTEAIRLLRSEKFDELTGEQIRDIAEYRSIEIGEENFFDKPFTTGKEVSASLAYAQRIGREVVLSDLRRLAESALGRSPV